MQHDDVIAAAVARDEQGVVERAAECAVVVAATMMCSVSAFAQVNTEPLRKKLKAKKTEEASA